MRNLRQPTVIDIRICWHHHFSGWGWVFWRRRALEDADSATWVNDWEIWIGPLEIRKARDFETASEMWARKLSEEGHRRGILTGPR